VLVWQQQRVELRRCGLVPEEGTGVGEEGHAEEPLGVEVLPGEIPRQQAVEGRAGIPLAA
jgi:hypothetical protein